MAIVRIFLVLVLMIGLTACGAGGQGPDRQLVKQAISIQINQTQQALAQQLRLGDSKPTGFEINRVEIQEQQPLQIQDLPAFRITGTYDLTLDLPKRRVVQHKNPFQVYLQKQREGKSWRLAQPRGGSEETGSAWVTQLLGLPEVK